jgi:hypothetical protein
MSNVSPVFFFFFFFLLICSDKGCDKTYPTFLCSCFLFFSFSNHFLNIKILIHYRNDIFAVEFRSDCDLLEALVETYSTLGMATLPGANQRIQKVMSYKAEGECYCAVVATQDYSYDISFGSS